MFLHFVTALLKFFQLASRLILLTALLSAFWPKAGFAMSETVAGDSVDVVVSLDSLFYQELVISGKKNPVTMKGDTLIFDVSGFSVPEGAKLRVLLERIPGVEILHDGRILAHGQEVVRIKLNGRNFFNENPELALNSFAADALAEVKLYKEHSDEEKATGVYRQEGEQVLDIYTSPDRTKGWMADIVGAGGSKKRYQASTTWSGFSPDFQSLVSCSADNQPSVFGVEGSYLNKLSAETNVNEVVRQGYNGIANIYKEKWQVNVAAFFNNGKTESASKTNTEYYWDSPKVFALTENEKKTDTYSGNITLDWAYQGNSLSWKTKFYMNHSDYDHEVNSQVDTRETYPSLQTPGLFHERSQNMSRYQNIGSLQSLGGGLTTMLTKSWGSKGDNILVSAGVNYTGNREYGFTHADIYYTKTQGTSHQVMENYSKKRGTRAFAKMIYTWAVLPELKFQLSYGAERLHDRVRQDVNDLSFAFLSLVENVNLPADSLNKRARLTTWLHDCCARVQFEKAGWCASGAVTFEPQKMFLHYQKYVHDVDSVQTLWSFLPELSLTYQNVDKWNMSFRYMGRRKQPDFLSMLPVWDNTDPLHRYIGNAGLKPETNHILSLSFFSFALDLQRQLNIAVNAIVNQNNITQRLEYDSDKGAYSVMPVNVNGNWNASFVLDYITSFHKAPACRLEWQSTVNGGVEHAYQVRQKLRRREPDLLTKVSTFATTHSGAFLYKFRFLRVKPYAYVRWARYWNDAQDEVESNLRMYGWGALLQLDLDCGMSMSADCYQNCRNGYQEADMNGKEWICNLELSYSFLRNKSLELKLQGFDLFRQVHSVNQSNTVQYRQEIVHRKGINSYLMLCVNFHFDRFFIKG